MAHYNGKLRSLAFNKEASLGGIVNDISGATWSLARFPIDIAKTPNIQTFEGATGSNMPVYEREDGEPILEWPIGMYTSPNDDTGLVLYSVWGDDAVSTTSGATIHTYTLRDLETSLPSYTIYADQGFAKYRYTSAQCGRFEFNVAHGDTGGVPLDTAWAAQDEGVDASSTSSPSLGASPYFSYKDLCVDVNDGTYNSAAVGGTVYGVNFVVDRQGESKRGSCSSGKQSEWVSGDGVLIQVRLDLWVGSDYATEFYDKFVAQTALTQLNFRLRGPAISGTVGGYNRFEANLKNLRILEANKTIEAGGMKASVLLQCDGDTASANTITLENEQATAYSA